MKKEILPIIVMILTFAFIPTFQVMAADTTTDTKIIIEATDDNTVSEDLKYAINSNDESAFSSNNVFEVKKGESYIVYVKDLAGNITSKIITVNSNGDVSSSENNSSSGNSGGSKKSSSNKSSGTNIQVKPAANTNASTVTPTQNTNDGYVDNTRGTGSTIYNGPSGNGSVIEENISSEVLAEKEFYTIQTEDGNVFYLIIDRTQNSENVYFLDSVKEKDLLSLAVGETDNFEETEPEGENENLLFQKEEVETETEEEEIVPDNNSKKQNDTSSSIFIIIVCVVVALVGYYFKIYKPKQKRLDDAYDLDDDFEAIETEEEEMYIPKPQELEETKDKELED